MPLRIARTASLLLRDLIHCSRLRIDTFPTGSAHSLPYQLTANAANTLITIDGRRSNTATINIQFSFTFSGYWTSRHRRLLYGCFRTGDTGY